MKSDLASKVLAQSSITEGSPAEAGFERAYENEQTLNALLRTVIQHKPLTEILQDCLDVLLSVSWLSILPKGGILLVEGEEEVLTLVANRNLSPELLTICHKVPFGRCLCGRAAREKKLIHASCVDERHENRFDGMKPHGHYNVPIMDEDVVLGVLVLYLPHGHSGEECESRFLNAVADVLSLAIQQKRVEEAIRYQAECDPLTGVNNRASFFEKFERILETKRQADEGKGCLLVMDLDHFKDINDLHGHEVGDQLLKATADRLVQCTRDTDIVSRLGGDEFAVVLPGSDEPPQCDFVISKIHKALTEPIKIRGRMFEPRYSIGATIFPRDGHDAPSLYYNADIALYEAKAKGRNTWCYFEAQLKEYLQQRNELSRELKGAIARGELEIALQPQFKIADQSHAGLEVLVRWSNNEKQISPAHFIPIAEENNLVSAIGEQVLHKSLAAVRKMLDDGLKPGLLAVNVSPIQLKDEGFAETVADALSCYEIAGDQVEFEITETALLDRSSDKIEQTLHEIRELGIKLALDDFGTGYASLAHLKRFPIDRLKIDKTFVGDITDDPADAVIAVTILNLAHNLGLEVVAEGIEEPHQLEFLRRHGCDYGQGKLIAMPLFLDDFVDYLTQASRIH